MKKFKESADSQIFGSQALLEELKKTFKIKPLKKVKIEKSDSVKNFLKDLDRWQKLAQRKSNITYR